MGSKSTRDREFTKIVREDTLNADLETLSTTSTLNYFKYKKKELVDRCTIVARNVKGVQKTWLKYRSLFII